MQFQRFDTTFRAITMEIEGSYTEEFDYCYSAGEKELAFVTALPVLSYFYVSGGTLSVNSNTGVILKNVRKL